MSNHTTAKQSIRIWNEHIKRKMSTPNDWILLNRPNCIDIVCKTVITEHDRFVIKSYFVNAEMCIWAWQNGFKHRNVVHLIGKGLRKKCQFCKKTFTIDDLAGYRVHIIHDHISKNKFGKFRYMNKDELRTLPEMLVTQTPVIETPDVQLTKIQQRKQQIITEITPRLIRRNTMTEMVTKVHIER